MSTLFLNTILFLAVIFLISVNLSYFCTRDNAYAFRFRKTTTFKNITHTAPANTGLPLIPPFIPFRSTFVASQKYRLAACRIQKNLSTILLNLFCFLNTPRKYTKTVSSLTIEFKNFVSVETCNATHATHIATDKSYATKLAILRDPVERFLSAFVDKCIHEAKRKQHRCYGCKRNMTCVVKKQYERFQLIAEGKLSNYSYEDRHFAPMSWFCDFDSKTIKNYQFLYFGETEEDQADTIYELMAVLEDHGVDNSTVAHISSELSANRTKHSTSGSVIRENVGKKMRTDSEVMKWLRLIYENDYKTFGISSPFE